MDSIFQELSDGIYFVRSDSPVTVEKVGLCHVLAHKMAIIYLQMAIYLDSFTQNQYKFHIWIAFIKSFRIIYIFFTNDVIILIYINFKNFFQRCWVKHLPFNICTKFHYDRACETCFIKESVDYSRKIDLQIVYRDFRWRHSDVSRQKMKLSQIFEMTILDGQFVPCIVFISIIFQLNIIYPRNIHKWPKNTRFL